jgi:hypothetical protein
VFLALLAALPAAAAADDTAALTRDIAAPWPGLQREDGSYYDYLKPYGGGRYSEAMLGLALLQVGLRDGDDRSVSSGLRGVGYALAHGDRQAADPSVFETFALAAAYNVARGRLPGIPASRRSAPPGRTGSAAYGRCSWHAPVAPSSTSTLSRPAPGWSCGPPA